MRQDIRPIKAELRNRFKALRAGLSPAEKDEMDLKILNLSLIHISEPTRPY